MKTAGSSRFETPSMVSVEQAAWKPDGSVDCIWETLSHLYYFNNAYLQRFKGNEYEYDVADNNETFNTGEYTETEWQADVERFDAVVSEWRSLIAAADASKFSESVPTNTSRVWADVIADVNAHNACHGGQIVLLRKLQRAWDTGSGVS
ncbi:MAG: DinB family protein [Pyrinomonadaceae bacterium]|nr:DinB family protein [Blastocatellia bacterium]MCW5956340.1 DinB family protein [Pyrinomonadaceae bacterium]